MGYIKLNRNICNGWMWKESKEKSKFEAWIDLVFIARYVPFTDNIRGNLIHVGRGQLAYSQDTLAERWGWSRGKVIRFLNVLETEQLITQQIAQQTIQQTVQQKSKLITLITIVNYDQISIDSTTDSTTDSTSNDTTGSTSDSTTTKEGENKGKPMSKERIGLFDYPPEESKKIILPFISDEFKEAWDAWIEYRKQKKKKPYVPVGLKATLTELKNMAKGKESSAIKIIHHAISKNWAGFYMDNDLLAKISDTATQMSFDRFTPDGRSKFSM